NLGETWQEAGAREVKEETGLTIEPAHLRAFAVHSAPDSTLLVFGLARPLRQAELPPFQLDAETLECQILTRPAEMAFSLHTAVVKAYFNAAWPFPSLP